MNATPSLGVTTQSQLFIAVAKEGLVIPTHLKTVIMSVARHRVENDRADESKR
jgi:hypothetical protein